mmetsp:Transcript_6068/g.9777  ORF Transcript_6068/g.9777 Transcript_6068/m.9777 type:complete len:167 (+) Transcript_6068:189-689(+)
MKQALKAVQALQKYAKKVQGKKTTLLENENMPVHLNFTLTQLPSHAPTPKPLQVELPNAFTTKENLSRVCIFVKDPEADFKKEIEALNIPCIAEVIGFDRLRREFREYSDKKKLLREYDLFLADIRVYKMLPECLGREFYAKKMFPFPLKVHNLGPEETAAKDLEA